MDAFGIPGEWLKVFTGTNISVMAGIGVIAFIMEYSRKFPEGWVILVPPMFGAGWGALLGIDAQMTDGASIATHVAQSCLVNAGAAAVFGRGISFMLRKYWRQTEDAPAPPYPQQPGARE